MTERPILFNGDMVRALLDGRKTVTRRPLADWQVPTLQSDVHPGDRPWIAIAQRHPRWGFGVFGHTEAECAAELAESGCCPFGKVHHRLWVREAFIDLLGTGIEHRPTPQSPLQRYVYRADIRSGSYADETRKEFGLRWRPSIHMPRAASRILLEVTAVRVERLQAISLDQIRAEGLTTPLEGIEAEADLRGQWKDLWESTGGDWAANPWVWVVEFRVVPSEGQATSQH